MINMPIAPVADHAIGEGRCPECNRDSNDKEHRAADCHPRGSHGYSLQSPPIGSPFTPFCPTGTLVASLKYGSRIALSSPVIQQVPPDPDRRLEAEWNRG